MGLFSRKRKRSAETPATPASAASSSIVDGALDTLAHVLRAFGNPAVRLDGESTETFRERCEALARHVLVAAPLDEDSKKDSEGNGTAPVLGRNWKVIRHFVTERRRAEVAHVDDHVGGLKVAIWDLVAGLQTLASGGQKAHSSIERSVVALEKAAAGNSIEDLKAAVGAAAGQIKGALEEQRQALESEMAALGDKLAEMREELTSARREMSLDALTQLHNRGAFDEALGRFVQLATLGAQPLTLLMVDLDHFKFVNDQYGHPVGDKVIVASANCIALTFPRKGDFAARYGGEEFAVLLTDVDDNQTKPLAERLLDKVRDLRIDPGDGSGETIDISCSIGAATLGRGESAEALLARADAALYTAKRNGRDRVVVADPPSVA